MSKYSIAIALASIGAVTLHGCKSDDPKKDLIKLMDTATEDYGKVNTTESEENTKEKIWEACDAVKTAYDNGVKSWAEKNKDNEKAKTAEAVQKDGKGKEAHDKMVTAEQKCFNAGKNPKASKNPNNLGF